MAEEEQKDSQEGEDNSGQQGNGNVQVEADNVTVNQGSDEE